MHLRGSIRGSSRSTAHRSVLNILSRDFSAAKLVWPCAVLQNIWNQWQLECGKTAPTRKCNIQSHGSNKFKLCNLSWETLPSPYQLVANIDRQVPCKNGGRVGERVPESGVILFRS